MLLYALHAILTAFPLPNSCTPINSNIYVKSVLYCVWGGALGSTVAKKGEEKGVRGREREGGQDKNQKGIDLLLAQGNKIKIPRKLTYRGNKMPYHGNKMPYHGLLTTNMLQQNDHSIECLFLKSFNFCFNKAGLKGLKLVKPNKLLTCVQYRYCLANCLQSMVVWALLVYLHSSVMHSFIHFSNSTSAGENLFIGKTGMTTDDIANKLGNLAMLCFIKCSGNRTDDKAGLARRVAGALELVDSINGGIYS